MSLLAPWYYQNLLIDNAIINSPEYYEVGLLSSDILIEAVCSLRKELKPEWVSISEVYSNRDGAGTSQYKNIAVYKAISEALERWAFYVTADLPNQTEFCFDENPSTTGMAAYPGFTAKKARDNAILEASERWALHEFWRGNLPVIEHLTNIENLQHFEIITPFNQIKVSLIAFKSNSQFLYSFAASNKLNESFHHALVELARNQRVMEKFKNEQKSYEDFKDISDKRLFFFSTEEGRRLFDQKIFTAAKTIQANPKLLCDKEIQGPWSTYTKVWRYLYAGSYPDNDIDHTIFMF